MKILFILLISISITANAKIYQCQDTDGNMQYTQTPSPKCLEEIAAPQIQTMVPNPENSEEEPSETVEQSQEPEIDVKNLSPEEIVAKNAEIQKRNCEMAYNALNTLNSDKPLAHEVKEDGKQVLYTEETRNQELANIQKFIDDNCVKQP
ncbi:MAG: DUF4124 domain-containing protein [Candidatus Marithrix sp.]|nr:DUF4124 domain-containing protein [Candidatus Marithrix sp.]